MRDARKSSPIGSVFQTRQGLFCLDPRDQIVTKALITRGEYGQAAINQILHLTSPEARVLLLGAHIGSIAIPVAKRVGKVCALEANPQTFQLLRINKQINEADKLEIFRLAANDKEETLEFVLNTANSGGSKRMPLYRDEAYFSDQPETCQVKAVRLDDLFPDQKFELIFMDIEGSEYFAMRGMPNLIAKADVLISEFLPHHLLRVAGVTLQQFLQPLERFQTMIIPSQKKSCHASDFERALQTMMESGHGDDGLIFLKKKITVGFS